MSKNNRLSFQKSIKDGIAILDSGTTLHHPNSLKEIYRSDSNFYYLTGLSTPDIISVITPDRYVLFATSPDELQSLWDGPTFTLEDLKEVSGADEVWEKDFLLQKLPEYLFGKDVIYYSFQKDLKIYDEIVKLVAKNKERNKKVPHMIWNLDDIIQEMRIIKTDDEVQKIRKAISITTEAYNEIFQIAKPGVFEHEIEAICHHIYIKNGGRDAFPPIIGSGPNSTILHYRKNDRCIQDGEILLVDSGAEYQHYCADVSRSWPVNKKFTNPQKQMYEKLLRVQKEIIAQIKPGIVIAEWVKGLDTMIAEALIELNLVKGEPEQIVSEKTHKKYYPHSLGHWLGLDVHDIGNTYRRGESRVFEAGMVLTVEPGLYVPLKDLDAPSDFRGMGMRIEDDILVTENGYENLTQGIPKEIEFFEN